MRRSRVFIFEPNEFDLDLMSDVVECNDLQAVGARALDALDATSPAFSGQDVVVVDFDLPGDGGRKLLDRLWALPRAERPRIVGVAAGGRIDDVDGSRVEAVVARPIDIGGFARTVVRQAREATLD